MRRHGNDKSQLLEMLRLAQARREGRITEGELLLAIRRLEGSPSASQHGFRRTGALLLAACVAAAATVAYF